MNLDLFRERLLVKAHALIPNGFMGNAINCCLINLLVTLTR